MLKQKHVDASREVRLWVSQIIIPIGALIVLTNDEAREKLKEAVDGVGQKVMRFLPW